MNMIEKVARSIGNDLYGWVDPEAKTTWGISMNLAKVAIEAMRHVTPEMHKAWEDGYYQGYDGIPENEQLGREAAFKCFNSAHNAMIDAALKEADQ